MSFSPYSLAERDVHFLGVNSYQKRVFGELVETCSLEQLKVIGRRVTNLIRRTKEDRTGTAEELRIRIGNVRVNRCIRILTDPEARDSQVEAISTSGTIQDCGIIRSDLLFSTDLWANPMNVQLMRQGESLVLALPGVVYDKTDLEHYLLADMSDIVSNYLSSFVTHTLEKGGYRQLVNDFFYSCTGKDNPASELTGLLRELESKGQWSPERGFHSKKFLSRDDFIDWKDWKSTDGATLDVPIAEMTVDLMQLQLARFQKRLPLCLLCNREKLSSKQPKSKKDSTIDSEKKSEVFGDYMKESKTYYEDSDDDFWKTAMDSRGFSNSGRARVKSHLFSECLLKTLGRNRKPPFDVVADRLIKSDTRDLLCNDCESKETARCENKFYHLYRFVQEHQFYCIDVNLSGSNWLQYSVAMTFFRSLAMTSFWDTLHNLVQHQRDILLFYYRLKRFLMIDPFNPPDDYKSHAPTIYQFLLADEPYVVPGQFHTNVKLFSYKPTEIIPTEFGPIAYLQFGHFCWAAVMTENPIQRMYDEAQRLLCDDKMKKLWKMFPCDPLAVAISDDVVAKVTFPCSKTRRLLTYFTYPYDKAKYDTWTDEEWDHKINSEDRSVEDLYDEALSRGFMKKFRKWDKDHFETKDEKLWLGHFVDPALPDVCQVLTWKEDKNTCGHVVSYPPEKATKDTDLTMGKETTPTEIEKCSANTVKKDKEESMLQQAQGGDDTVKRDRNESTRQQAQGGEETAKKDSEESTLRQTENGDETVKKDQIESTLQQAQGDDDTVMKDKKESTLQQAQGDDETVTMDRRESTLQQAQGSDKTVKKDQIESTLQQAQGGDETAKKDQKKSTLQQAHGREETMKKDRKESTLQQVQGGDETVKDDRKQSTLQQAQASDKTAKKDGKDTKSRKKDLARSRSHQEQKKQLYSEIDKAWEKIQSSPHFSKGYEDMAMVLSKSDYPFEAKSAFEAALRVDPNNEDMKEGLKQIESRILKIGNTARINAVNTQTRPFDNPVMWAKLATHPETKKYFKDADYNDKLKQLKQRKTTLIRLLTEDKHRFEQTVDALLGIPLFNTQLNDDDASLAVKPSGNSEEWYRTKYLAYLSVQRAISDFHLKAVRELDANNVDSSLQLGKKALHLAQSYDAPPHDMAKVHEVLGDAYTKKREWENAVMSYDKSLCSLHRERVLDKRKNAASHRKS